MLITMSSKQLSKRAAFFFSLPQEFLFMLAFFYFVSPFQNFGDFLCQNVSGWNGRNIANRLLKNEEHSDSIGIIIAIIIDVNY